MKRKKYELGQCPICGTSLVRMWGYGWDWDKAVCPERLCCYEKELDVSSGIDPDGKVFRMQKPKEEEP